MIGLFVISNKYLFTDSYGSYDAFNVQLFTFFGYGNNCKYSTSKIPPNTLSLEYSSLDK